MNTLWEIYSLICMNSTLMRRKIGLEKSSKQIGNSAYTKPGSLFCKGHSEETEIGVSLTLDIFKTEKESKQQDIPTSKSRKISDEGIMEEKLSIKQFFQNPFNIRFLLYGIIFVIIDGFKSFLIDSFPLRERLNHGFINQCGFIIRI